MDDFIISYLPYPTVSAAFLYWWLLSKGELGKAYKVAIVMYLGYMVIETDLALRHPDQLHLLVFNAINVWAIAMAVKGLMRLKRVH